MSCSQTISKLREDEMIHEIKLVLKVVANWMAIPLFMLFWIADLIYVPEQKWLFLFLRLTIIPFCFIASKLIIKEHTFDRAQLIVSMYLSALALPINLMVYYIGDIGTGYYAGLNLIAVGGLSFIPFNRKYFFGTTIGIYLPYYLIVLFKSNSLNDLKFVFINSFFIIGSIVICFLIRFFNERLRIKELDSRIALQSEISNRDNVIKNKTDEAIRLNSLSTQFSPQVVQAIKDGRVDLEKGVHRSKICAIFVDIVGSTERVVRLDQSKTDLVLARFMDTVVSIFLKYDLTIDKFQGDGILAFSNDPIKHLDFIQRTCLSALEVRTALQLDREFYILNWKKEMQIRIGISAGYANVGFYGNKKFFRSYTAIGTPLPFASRLTNLAEPNQILVDSDIAQLLNDEKYLIKSIGEKRIKGFDEDQHIIFELLNFSHKMTEKQTDIVTCPHCPNSILYLDTNEKGIFVMKCRECGFQFDETNSQANISVA